MATLRRPRVLASAVIITSLATLAIVPVVEAAKIPERAYVPAGVSSVIHVRIDDGCAGAATDRIEVTLPKELAWATPEAIPGWTVESKTVPVTATSGSAGERVSKITWSGGSLPDGTFMDFGFRTLVPDLPGTVLEFPVTQSCGTKQKVYAGIGSGLPVPFVRIDEPITVADIATIADSVDELLADVESIQEQIASVQSPRLRERVVGIEASGEALALRMTALRERIRSLETALEAMVDPAVK